MRLGIVNAYAAFETDRWFLIDTGFGRDAGRIRRATERQFGRPPEHIVLNMVTLTMLAAHASLLPRGASHYTPTR